MKKLGFFSALQILRNARLLVAFALVAVLLSAIVVSPPRIVRAATFGPVNLVVLRVGDGGAALAATATAVFLDEYTQSGGTPVQTIAVPTADAGGNQTLTIGGTSASEGALNRSYDGRFLSLAGYDTAPGTTASGSTSAAVNRIVGRVDSTGAIDTTTRISDAYSTNNFRSAVTNDGTEFWTTGNSGGIRSVLFGSAGTSTSISATPANSRVASIQRGYNGFPSPQLYVSASTGAFQGVSTIGSGVPTTTGQTPTQLPGFPTTAGPSAYGYVFYDLNAGVAGVDTLYVADDRASASGGIQKWTYDGTTWTLAYTFITGVSIGSRGLAGTVSGTGVPILYATTAEASANRIVRVEDTGAASVVTTIATAGANTAFRGIAFAPLANGGPTAGDGIVSGRILDTSGAPIEGAVVNLSGTENRKTITDVNGNYRFENVETTGFYTVAPSQLNYSFDPAEKSFSLLGNNVEATFTGSRMANVNPLDTPEYFVRQHYLDFLGREPDEAGFNFWSDQIISCGADADCTERRTINVSAAYFQSVEFQRTGGLIDRLYRASFGRNPSYAEFMPDRSVVARDLIVGKSGWEEMAAMNEDRFVEGFVERAQFRTAFDGLSNGEYVDRLISNTEVSFTAAERNALVSGLSSGTLSRAGALHQIVADEDFARARFNATFVMMEYFGYLRRDPDPSGYDFWLNKLNQFDGNFERAEMVKAFINSGEYRARFVR